MYNIIPVKTKKQLKQFVQFQLDLYKGCEYFVPPFFGDELKALDPKKSVYQGEDADCQCFLCVDENQNIVGRICAIISHQYNKKNNEKRMRISRFDSIEDFEVAKLLFETAENWGKERGMEVVHGPLGFNDLEREGLLIEGFDLLTTFNSQYYYPYYKVFFEKLGYAKEVDWLEFRFKLTSTCDDRTAKMCDLVSKRYNVRELEVKNINWLVKNYYDEIFDLLDEAYGSLYGTVPITKRVRDSLISQFKIVLNKDLISILVDENNKIVGVGIIFPSIAQSLHDCNGKLFPTGWTKILHELKNFDVIEMALIGVKKEYQDKGITAIIFHNIIGRIKQKYSHIKYCETNLQLEDNYKVQQLFLKAFDTQQVRRRRCYYKSLNGKEVVLHKCIETQ